MNFNRLKRVRDKMLKHGFDHLVITSPDAIFYLIGEEIHPGERLLALSISQEKAELILSSLFPIQRDLGIPVIYFKDTEKPVEILSSFIGESLTIGVDKNWESHFLLKLMKLKPDCQFEIGSPSIDEVRLCKDEFEAVKMREASLINDKVMLDVMTYIKEERKHKTLTEMDVQKKVVDFNAAYGVHEMSFTPTVCFGKNGAEPHHDVDLSALSENDTVVIDIGGRLNGYCSDMTRSFVVGEASEKYKEVYEIVKQANLKAIEKVKPGVRLSDVDQAARDVIEAAGYGEYFTHRTGHGIGINVHEFPDVSGTSDSVCEVGMVFSIEPGVYLLGEFGIRIEDLVMVTETGCEILNKVDKELIVL